MTERYQAKHQIRVVTAGSLFDGHDASINIIRRLLQAGGAEVIHLGHNRSALDVVTAAIQEDAQAIAVSSYQGGHMEFFQYMRKLLDERGATHVKIFGGGGGVIVPNEARTLEANGIERIYSPEDGRRMGLLGIIDDLLLRCDYLPWEVAPIDVGELRQGNDSAIARAISLAESELENPGTLPPTLEQALKAHEGTTPIVGITGTGGCGKSSLTDELLRRYLFDFPDHTVAVISVDPTRRRTGGALLGDRIRMNALDPQQVYMRSMATRRRKGELSGAINEAVAVCGLAGFDLIVVETSGIGQGDTDIVDLADTKLYVMTPEYGAPSQLEKIDMLDFADLISVNKFEKRGSMDALRDVRKQVRRNRNQWECGDDELPVYGTIASRFNDLGVTALYGAILDQLGIDRPNREWPALPFSPPRRAVIDPSRERYLAEISTVVKEYRQNAEEQITAARRQQRLADTLAEVVGTPAEPVIRQKLDEAPMDKSCSSYLEGWDDKVSSYKADEFVYCVRGREIRQPLYSESLARQPIPRVAVPNFTDHGEILRFGLLEGLPGEYPFTAG
ncbi:MAG: methylmalonyl-CoA mutase, partial [Proteobacteria bacterium]|nr:methylmalonyl-CoA mutase [Pseudomonadota bacterium]